MICFQEEPMTKIHTGLELLKIEKNFQKEIKGSIGLLCHNASIDSQFNHAIEITKSLFGPRLKKLFGPQHGLITDVQDNMVETEDFIHPHFKLPVYSLYSETRIPTDEMLEGIDTLLIDLQDVGTRVYTYISTLGLIMEACGKKDIEVVILDRPNPVGGDIIEGNVLDPSYKSFVGHFPFPMRHGLTMGEVANFCKTYGDGQCALKVIQMEGWKRSMTFNETGLPWVLPSPNLPTWESAFTFVGTVLFEGTFISEGRGTTRSLEIVGHPNLEPYSFKEKFLKKCESLELSGFNLRPLYFRPTFQKHAQKTCGGFQIHPTNLQDFRPWTLGQVLCHELFHTLGPDFQWNKSPYEYEFERPAIDMINGTHTIREWIEENRPWEDLKGIEENNWPEFLNKRESTLLYK